MSTAFAIVSPESYVTACPSCGAISDMAEALLCDCLTREHTPVCPSCGGCFCKLPRAKLRAFWEAAPPAMLARHLRKPTLRIVRTPVTSKAPLVMLVDDDDEIRSIGEHVISRLGYRCVTASNGPEALALMAVDEPALVLTDALMPKMDGRDLCRFIKKSSSAKVVIMTSLYTAPHYKYEAFKSFGADDYLAKPIDFTALQETLHRLVPAQEIRQ